MREIKSFAKVFPMNTLSNGSNFNTDEAKP